MYIDKTWSRIALDFGLFNQTLRTIEIEESRYLRSTSDFCSTFVEKTECKSYHNKLWSIDPFREAEQKGILE